MQETFVTIPWTKKLSYLLIETDQHDITDKLERDKIRTRLFLYH